MAKCEKVIPVPVPPPAEYKLTLTQREYEALVWLSGKQGKLDLKRAGSDKVEEHYQIFCDLYFAMVHKPHCSTLKPKPESQCCSCNSWTPGNHSADCKNNVLHNPPPTSGTLGDLIKQKLGEHGYAEPSSDP